MSRAIRILLVENDDLIRDLIGDCLQEWEHNITAVKTAASALKLLRAGEFDLLMTALFMPLMDGLELARRARQYDPAVKIALVTGYRREIVNDAVRSGLIDLIIKKPFETPGLREEIKTLFKTSP